MKEEIKKLGLDMYNSMGGMSESLYSCIAREALNGVVLAGNPTNKTEVVKAAFNGIKTYFITWNDVMIKELAVKFTEAYTK